jgi:hypothetical protein
VDLVERQARAEQRPCLGHLAAKGVRREVLDLGRVGVDLPVGRVGVAPLRADRHLDVAPLQPRSEERLRATVRARGVEVAHAAVVRGVEHRVGVALERGDRAISAEVRAVPEREIARAPERREAETDGRDRQRRGPQRPVPLDHGQGP